MLLISKFVELVNSGVIHNWCRLELDENCGYNIPASEFYAEAKKHYNS